MSAWRPLLTVDELSVRYGKSLAVDSCSLRLGEAECIGIVGPNGAGKSSLLKALAGVVEIASGSATLDGELLNHSGTRSRLHAGLALVPEGRRVFPQLSVRDNLLAGAHASDRSTRTRRVDEMLDRFEILGERREVSAGLLSGGQQQVLAIARGLMSQPRCLMIDEFSLGLSPNVVKHVSEVVRETVAGGVAVLLVEQNPSILESLCSRVYVMRERQLESEFALPADFEALDSRVRSLV